MQERHKDIKRYFEECALSTERYYMPYLQESLGVKFNKEYSVLEVGCAKGGNLAPFAALECGVTGLDIHKEPVEEAKEIFAEKGLKGTFIHSNVFDYNDTSCQFDLIMMRDVIEHIGDKETLLLHLKKFLKKNGILFLAFPAWQMPFGGHQQIALSKLLSHLPYFHLLPKPLYRFVLKTGGETDGMIKGLMEIKDTRITLEKFNRLVRQTDYEVVNRRLYFINPHYEVKFGLKPRLLLPVVGKVPYIRNFFTTTCFCLLRKK